MHESLSAQVVFRLLASFILRVRLQFCSFAVFASSTHRSYANDPMPEELRADAITMRYIK